MIGAVIWLSLLACAQAGVAAEECSINPDGTSSCSDLDQTALIQSRLRVSPDTERGEHENGPFEASTPIMNYHKEQIDVAEGLDFSEEAIKAHGTWPWAVTVGPCTQESATGCIMSPNYPRAYKDSSDGTCKISATANSPAIEVRDFVVEAGYDYLKVNGQDYDSGAALMGKVPAAGGQGSETIEWNPDSSVNAKGWKICPRAGGGPTPAPTPAPTAAPTPAPTAAPTPATTAAPPPDAPVRVTKQSLSHALRALAVDDTFVTALMHAFRAGR